MVTLGIVELCDRWVELIVYIWLFRVYVNPHRRLRVAALREVISSATETLMDHCIYNVGVVDRRLRPPPHPSLWDSPQIGHPPIPLRRATMMAAVLMASYAGTMTSLHFGVVCLLAYWFIVMFRCWPPPMPPVKWEVKNLPLRTRRRSDPSP
ncbi:hypothetical protein F4808DRAFT_30624 [Astrocystis sublimbata]|nr:hypothetical protein F4808DRAFT_30624 [Astrocystis sublimbata]